MAEGESKTPAMLILIVGIFLVGALIGIFFPNGISKEEYVTPAINDRGYIEANNVNPNETRETDAYYTKADIDQPVCGIKIFSPLPGQKVEFPLEVSGYVNGCNWVPFENETATLEIRDMNQSLSKLIIIPKENPNDYTLPAYFKIKVNLENNPTSQNGVLIFHNQNTAGAVSETFQVPIIY